MNWPASLVTTDLAYLVGRSVVSAITQTPASGPLGPVTWPPMESGLTDSAFCCALAGPLHAIANAAIAAPVRHAFEWRRKVMVCSRFVLLNFNGPAFRQCEILSCIYNSIGRMQIGVNVPHLGTQLTCWWRPYRPRPLLLGRFDNTNIDVGTTVFATALMMD